MPDSYVISGTTDPSKNGTTEVVLAKDSQGEPSKVISTTQPAELSKNEKDKLTDLGIEVEKVSADDVVELEESSAQQVGSDAAVAGPLLGSGSGSSGPIRSESTKKKLGGGEE